MGWALRHRIILNFEGEAEGKRMDRVFSLAREYGADAYADQINEIANTPGIDSNAARVKIQALQWQWLYFFAKSSHHQAQLLELEDNLVRIRQPE